MCPGVPRLACVRKDGAALSAGAMRAVLHPLLRPCDCDAHPCTLLGPVYPVCCPARVSMSSWPQTDPNEACVLVVRSHPYSPCRQGGPRNFALRSRACAVLFALRKFPARSGAPLASASPHLLAILADDDELVAVVGSRDEPRAALHGVRSPPQRGRRTGGVRGNLAEPCTRALLRFVYYAKPRSSRRCITPLGCLLLPLSAGQREGRGGREGARSRGCCWGGRGRGVLSGERRAGGGGGGA